MWAHLRYVPLDLRSLEGLGWVAGALGNPKETDGFTINMFSLVLSHVKVEMNLTKPLPRTIKLPRQNGEFIVVEVDYPWMPSTWLNCGELGHLKHNYLLPIKEEKPKDQVQPNSTDLAVETLPTDVPADVSPTDAPIGVSTDVPNDAPPIGSSEIPELPENTITDSSPVASWVPVGTTPSNAIILVNLDPSVPVAEVVKSTALSLQQREAWTKHQIDFLVWKIYKLIKTYVTCQGMS